MTKNKRRCAIAGSIIFGIFAIALGRASFSAIVMISDSWHAVDYWLAWFSSFSMLGSVGCAILFGIWLGIALNCDLDQP